MCDNENLELNWYKILFSNKKLVFSLVNNTDNK